MPEGRVGSSGRRVEGASAALVSAAGARERGSFSVFAALRVELIFCSQYRLGVASTAIVTRETQIRRCCSSTIRTSQI